MVNTVGQDNKTHTEADKNKPLSVDENVVFKHEDLKDFNTEGHLRLVLLGEVYDLSNFDHPGGF